jgi:DMSO/TMAO reductase YedYZ molybdopterin-dependent catalytic subunit
VTGIVSAALAVMLGHLAGLLMDEAASPLNAVGAAAIDLSPPGAKEFAIRTFGTNDKPVLITGICVVLAVIAALMGIAAIKRRWVAYAGFIGFGAVGIIAAMTRPASGTLAPLPTLIGVVAGLVAATAMLRAFRGDIPTDTVGELPQNAEAEPGFDRRRFLVSGAAFAGATIASGVASTFAGQATKKAMASRSGLVIPKPASPAKTVRGTDLGIPGLSRFHTPNDTFYRVDTALFVPKVSAGSWRLRIHGKVERKISMSIDDLLARPLIERDITLTCVSNEVGGHYIGNARWIGAPLKPILLEAGIHPDADQLVSRSADGFTIGTPTSALLDGRDAMLAVAMNGEPLPLKHGFPVRMIVPGLYGYVSAMKWIVDMELTTFDAYDAYWVKRGWSKKAPIKTMSRIDTPSGGKTLRPGVVPVAGIAWAQHKGIAKVEVQIDDGEWHRARLGAEDTVDTWRQWVYEWPATKGMHRIRVRATDKTGYTQTSREVTPIPNGATGWHTRTVQVG